MFIFKKSLENKMNSLYSIYINPNLGRFGNQLFPIFVALSMYEEGNFKKIYFNDKRRKLNSDFINSKILDVMEFKSFNDSDIDNVKYFIDCRNNYVKQNYKDCINSSDNIIINGFHQNYEIINENSCRKYLSCPYKYKQQIFDLYGDISNYVCLHVRRGDYLLYSHRKLYNVLSKEYIERVINKHFKNDKIICISDDITWCKENLSNNTNIIFADKLLDPTVDFYIQTLTKGNICSGSSFSIAGVILNPNKDKKIIIPKPFFKNEDKFSDINLNLHYAIKEPIEL